MVGQFGAWTLIAAQQTATGYEVALKNGSADQYGVWNTDSSGNYVSAPIGDVSGTSAALESMEPSFNDDLNGDGIIGEASGGTTGGTTGTTRNDRRFFTALSDGDRVIQHDQPADGRDPLFSSACR